MPVGCGLWKGEGVGEPRGKAILGPVEPVKVWVLCGVRGHHWETDARE